MREFGPQQEFEPGATRPERTRHRDDVPRQPGVAALQTRWSDFADQRERERKRRRPHDVAAHDARAVPRREGRHAAITFEDPRFGRCGRHAERDRGEHGPRTHGGDVAEVRGHRPVPDGGRRHVRAEEMDAVDERVARDHRKMRAGGAPGRGIVADAEHDRARAARRRRLDDLPQSGDEGVLGQLRAPTASGSASARSACSSEAGSAAP